MKRYYKLFESTNNGRPPDKSSEFYQDEVLAFFIFCYHLKDWIKNDTDIQNKVNPPIEEFINSTEALRICADICNATKHLTLDRPRNGPNTDITFGIVKTEFSLVLNEGVKINDTQPAGQIKHKSNPPHTIGAKYKVRISKGEIKDAFELATECLQSWNDYLTTNKLI
ncbi:MAG: hypothetical protein WAX07_01575 [Candidatus Altiarchaeia archaeon]